MAKVALIESDEQMAQDDAIVDPQADEGVADDAGLDEDRNDLDEDELEEEEEDELAP
jgi:hypothetical protein